MKFFLNRIKDISGISGTGIVAQGFEFPDGQMVMQWINTGSIAIFKNRADLELVHGHKGFTQVVWETPKDLLVRAPASHKTSGYEWISIEEAAARLKNQRNTIMQYSAKIAELNAQLGKTGTLRREAETPAKPEREYDHGDPWMPGCDTQ